MPLPLLDPSERAQLLACTLKDDTLLKIKSQADKLELGYSWEEGIIGSNCPGISGTVPDLLTLSLVPEGLPICPGRSLISACT